MYYTHAGSPFCSRCTTFPLNVSISCGRFTTCIPVFSLGEDTPLTVSTLTPVSVERALSIESTDTPPADFNDLPSSFPPFTFFLASLLADTLLFAFEVIEDRSETEVLFAIPATLLPELLLEIVLPSSTEPLLTVETTALPLSVLEEFLVESFDDSTSFDTPGIATDSSVLLLSCWPGLQLFVFG